MMISSDSFGVHTKPWWSLSTRIAMVSLRLLFILMRIGKKHAHLVHPTDDGKSAREARQEPPVYGEEFLVTAGHTTCLP